jgi:hypothetical protein
MQRNAQDLAGLFGLLRASMSDYHDKWWRVKVLVNLIFLKLWKNHPEENPEKYSFTLNTLCVQW